MQRRTVPLRDVRTDIESFDVEAPLIDGPRSGGGKHDREAATQQPWPLRRVVSYCSRRLVLLACLHISVVLLSTCALFIVLVVGVDNLVYAVKHNEWPVFRDACETCSVKRCMKHCPMDKPLSIYFYDDLPLTKAETESKDFMRARNALLPFRTEDPNEACLFFPPVNTMCPTNKCTPITAVADTRLLRLPYWHGGQNHLLFDISDFDTRQGKSTKAINIRTNSLSFSFQPDFDVSVALFPILDDVDHDLALHKTVADRNITVGFRGSSYLAEKREKLVPWRWNFPPGKASIELRSCPNCWTPKDKILLRDLLYSTVFALAPSGYGAHSYRLMEAMACGAIPIVIADDFVLPLSSILPWSAFAIRVNWDALDELPDIIDSYSSADLERMRLRSLCA